MRPSAASVACGLVLLGAPALALPASTSLLAILLMCVVRGFGFALLVVVGSALIQAVKDSLDPAGQATSRTVEAVTTLVGELSAGVRSVRKQRAA